MEPLESPLIQQVVPASLIQSTKSFLQTEEGKKLRENPQPYGIGLGQGRLNLVAAHRLGVPLVTGTDSGNPLVFHGPAIHRELQLWVAAGVPPAAALQAATSNAAKLLGAGNRIGLIRAGYDANLIVVDGDPLKDIKLTEHISLIVFKGERISRGSLFEQE